MQWPLMMSCVCQCRDHALGSPGQLSLAMVRLLSPVLLPRPLPSCAASASAPAAAPLSPCSSCRACNAAADREPVNPAGHAAQLRFMHRLLSWDMQVLRQGEGYATDIMFPSSKTTLQRNAKRTTSRTFCAKQAAHPSRWVKTRTAAATACAAAVADAAQGVLVPVPDWRATLPAASWTSILFITKQRPVFSCSSKLVPEQLQLLRLQLMPTVCCCAYKEPRARPQA